MTKDSEYIAMKELITNKLNSNVLEGKIMGLGRMIISEEVFVELAKTAMNKVENVVTDSQSKDTLGQIVKSVAQRLSPHIHVKKNDREKERKPRLFK